MAKLVSVIVPVYNTKPYLRECVQSVLRQTHSDFELILVDDGSQDGSAEICESLCASDPRIRLLSRGHQGVSAARNAGLDEARGDYVFFLDSDDVIYPQLLEALVELCETTGASLATEVYLRVNIKDTLDFLDNADTQACGQWNHTLMDSSEALSQFFSSKTADHFSGTGGKLIRRHDIGTLRFDLSKENCEDTLFIYQLLKTGLEKNLRYVILWEKWYVYRLRPESSSQCTTIKYYEDTLQCWDYICRWELKQGRDISSVCAVRLSFRLQELYERSHRQRDKELTACLRAYAREEFRSGRFRLLPPVDRFAVWLLLKSFPLYVLARQVYRWLRERWGKD